MSQQCPPRWSRCLSASMAHPRRALGGTSRQTPRRRSSVIQSRLERGSQRDPEAWAEGSFTGHGGTTGPPTDQPPPAQAPAAPAAPHPQSTLLLHPSCLFSCDHSRHHARTDDRERALPMWGGNVPAPTQEGPRMCEAGVQFPALAVHSATHVVLKGFHPHDKETYNYVLKIVVMSFFPRKGTG